MTRIERTLGAIFWRKVCEDRNILGISCHNHCVRSLNYPSVVPWNSKLLLSMSAEQELDRSYLPKNLVLLLPSFPHAVLSNRSHSHRLRTRLIIMTIPPTDISTVEIFNKPTILTGFHLIPFIAQTVITNLPSSAYVLITDTHLAALHLSTFESAFTSLLNELPAEGRPKWLTRVIPPGETSKSREMKASLEDWLLENRCTRDTVILALGGGVIGDLVGFVSANFMRGVRYCQVPCSLLAMVDSAVGGKVSFSFLKLSIPRGCCVSIEALVRTNDSQLVHHRRQLILRWARI